MKEELSALVTEQRNQDSLNIDTCETIDVLKIINNEDKKVAYAVEQELDNIARAVDIITDKLSTGGRMFYIGAGTSGRLGVLDAVECPPTYGTGSEMIQAIISGNEEAMFKAVENVEDDEKAGENVIFERGITSKDVIIGIAASGRTPFVLGAIRSARRNGIFTIGISNNYGSKLSCEADLDITPVVGPEVVTGSTRMKAGTSQKMVLNMISTAVMIKMGKVYSNLMVDVKATNKKLIDRAVRIVMLAAETDYRTALNTLRDADMSSKAAIVMIKTGKDYSTVKCMLEKNNGLVAETIKIK